MLSAMADRPIKLRSPLRRRRLFIWLGRLMLLGIAAVTIAGFISPRTSDWRRFDHHSFLVSQVNGGDRFLIDDNGTSVPVHLLGTQAPPLTDPSTGQPAHGGAASADYLRARLNHQRVIIRLDTLQTRDSDGALLAYVYLTDTDCINADAIHDGMVYADRRAPHAYHMQYEQAENDARKKQRGLWRGLTENDMPAWRRAWLHSLVKDRLN